MHYKEKNFKDIEIVVLNLPAQSPDLNIIENLWAVLKRNTYNRKPAKIDKLIYLKTYF